MIHAHGCAWFLASHFSDMGLLVCSFSQCTETAFPSSFSKAWITFTLTDNPALPSTEAQRDHKPRGHKPRGHKPRKLVQGTSQEWVRGWGLQLGVGTLEPHQPRNPTCKQHCPQMQSSCFGKTNISAPTLYL